MRSAAAADAIEARMDATARTEAGGIFTALSQSLPVCCGQLPSSGYAPLKLPGRRAASGCRSPASTKLTENKPQFPLQPFRPLCRFYARCGARSARIRVSPQAECLRAVEIRRPSPLVCAPNC